MASDSMFMENLEEYVIDESRIVTYKWLSQTLGVHVNQAKQLLFTFVDTQRNEKQNDEISVVYFVAGVKKLESGDSIHQCSVIPEERLDAFKSVLESVTSCHVYSVQKSRLKDSNALYMSDYEKRPDDVSDYNKHGVIKCESAIIRSEEELRRLRGVKIPAETPQNNIQKTTNKTANGHGETTKSKPAKKNGVASMFAGAGKSTTTKSTKKEPETKSSDVKVSENKDKEKSSTTAVSKGKTQGGVQSFFSKQTASNETKVKSEDPKVKSEEPKERQTNEKSAKEKEIKEKPAKKSVTKGKGKKSRPQDSDDEPQSKKRRRIRNDVFDSSSEDDDVEMEPESPVASPPREATPPRDDSPPPDTKPQKNYVPDTPSPSNNNNSNTKKSAEKRRKRTRKLVPKTFMDDDGYMVTEKVWESDSTDASEVEEIENKKTTATTKNKDTVPTKKKAVQEKKPSPVKGNKQASLMSFFKKK